MGTLSRLVLLILMAVAALPDLTGADTCRQGPAASTQHCALPSALGNFQGYYECDTVVKVGRPIDKDELVDLVSHYGHIKGVGVGHSWWGTQFCSGNNSDSINIVTTELNTTLTQILNPVYFTSADVVPEDFPIQIDEDSLRVTVQAGIPQRIMLDYLAQYTSPKAPAGYSLPSFAWYIDQTIGGAVSTGTHGSSFEYKSVSSLVTRLEMAVANGTLINITADSNPAIWHAAQIAVGRLGVITEVELEIIRQDQVSRLVEQKGFWDFVDEIVMLQDMYNSAQNGTSDEDTAQLLASWEGTQFFWLVPSNMTIWLTYSTLEEDALAALATPPQATVAVSSLDPAGTPVASPEGLPVIYQQQETPALAPGPYLEDAFAQVPTPSLPPLLLPATDPAAWNNLYASFLSGFLTNGTLLRRDAILAETDFINIQTSDVDPYDQYEFSVKLERAGDCMQAIGTAMYKDDLLLGFPVPPLIRFVGEEQAFLANANGGPRIFFNIEDHISYQIGSNPRFDAVVAILRGDECQARMHWGKAGWEKWAKCFDGATEYPDSWCHFGCAVEALDPFGKFASESSVWYWRATVAGADVPFGQCCGKDGFMSSCTCAPRNNCI